MPRRTHPPARRRTMPLPPDMSERDEYRPTRAAFYYVGRDPVPTPTAAEPTTLRAPEPLTPTLTPLTSKTALLVLAAAGVERPTPVHMEYIEVADELLVRLLTTPTTRDLSRTYLRKRLGSGRPNGLPMPSAERVRIERTLIAARTAPASQEEGVPL